MITEITYKILNDYQTGNYIEIINDNQYCDFKIKFDGDTLTIRKDAIEDIIDALKKINDDNKDIGIEFK